jgi:hypothetical protein
MWRLRARADVACAPGTPWVTVRPHYGGPPSMAGRGPDERGRKPAGSGWAECPPSGPGRHGPGERNRREMARRKAAVCRKTGRDLRNARACRRAIPLTFPERRTPRLKQQGR